MKKRLLFIVILCISVSYCIFQKANANQYLSVITTLTLEEAVSLADNELSTGDCESRLMDTWTEHLSSGAYAIVHEYKCFMSGTGKCFEGKLYDYYSSGSIMLVSESKGSTIMCI